MPLPIAPLIGAGSSLLDTGLNALAQGITNRQSRKYAEKMYNLQRAHALEDWNRQNEYNSPEAQMQRLKAAGLNPNLVYGHGADAQGGIIRSTDTPSWRPESPHFSTAGVGQSLATIYDLQLKQAQTDNLKAQNTVAIQDAALRAAQVASTVASTSKTKVDTDAAKFSLSQAEALQDTSLETARQNLRKLTVDTDISLQANERAAAANAASLREAAERILNSRSQRATASADRARIRAQIENIKHDSTLKTLDIGLKKLGIQPSDELWQRVLARVLDGKGGVLENVKSAFGTQETPLTPSQSKELDSILNAHPILRKKR